MNTDQNGKNDTGRDEISGISDLPIAEAAVAAAPKVTFLSKGANPGVTRIWPIVQTPKPLSRAVQPARSLCMMQTVFWQRRHLLKTL